MVVSDESGLNIDCGATIPPPDLLTLRMWVTDDKYIKTGENKLLLTPTNLPQMSTLRSFPKGSNNNCYNLPLKSQSKYLVRAGFYYGNYDNLQKPPTFGLQLQSGSVNVKVTTSLDFDPIYHEFIIFTTKSNFDVCLVQTQEDQTPFISTLEVTIIDQKAYRLMNENMALYLESRINYGVDKSVPERLLWYDEKYNRIWRPQEDPRYLSNQYGFSIQLTSMNEENSPPDVVMCSSIEAHNASESIVLPIKFRQKSQVSAYFVLYFDVIAAYKPFEDARTVSISIDGQLMNTTQLPGLGSGEVVSMYPVKVTGGMATLTIASAGGTTTSPPALLNAMEVFSVLDVSNVGRSSESVLGSSFSLVLLLSMLYCMEWIDF
ncbi:uncharacterized protein At1g24485-like [Humulus lupulus]|uniref:uncharacterized protein At1g24485-like n=1 Tax=Humulus lupulus TaxID=3486 RepID=UPI002B417812|nr:uncharacterized protein At1g24485-like [Humulus lupulus]